jgi:dipeptidyl aminopeptidase/acylaminoacyl peptidase
MILNELPPKQILFSGPEKINLQLSPDGQKITYLSIFNGAMNIWLRSTHQLDDKVLTQEKDNTIYSYFWLADNKSLIIIKKLESAKNFTLVKFDIETKNYINLIENFNGKVIAYKREFPDDLLVCLRQENKPVEDVYKFNLSDSSLEFVEKNPGNIISWLADNNLMIKAAIGFDNKGQKCLFTKNMDQKKWELDITWTGEDAGLSSPLCFNEQNDKIYIRDSRQHNTTRLMLFNLKTKENSVVAADENHEFNGIFCEPKNNKLITVIFAKQRQEHEVIDQAYSQDINNIKNHLDGDFAIIDSSSDFSKWLVSYTNESNPAIFYLYDTQTKNFSYLCHANSRLNKYEFGKMIPVSYAARDGLKIDGYLTFPTQSKTLKKLPMIIIVHPGPWLRDIWGYHAVVQWLATRGYAVLQVNYRGSAGYGKKFIEKGYKQWGHEMHDDIEDAAKWAIASDIADPKKIAIMGSAYGGYESMVAATKNPELFCCAINIGGPLDLKKLVNSFNNSPSIRDSFFVKVGDPLLDSEKLNAASPINNLDDLKIPVMIAHGKNDPRVDIQDIEKMLAKLKENNIDHEHLVFEDESTNFTKQHNNMLLFACAESFLAKHLGGAREI